MNTDRKAREPTACVFVCPRIVRIPSVFGCVHLWLLLLSPTFAGEIVRLSKDGDFKQHLQWSPDGKKFLFTRIGKGKMGLWTMNADGSGLRRLFQHDEGPDFDGHWSP